MRSVWWKCPIGHSWKAKINERAIEGKECRVCEKEYQSVFPQLVVSYYAAKKGLKVLLGLTDFIGLPLEIYMPEEGLAIETTVGTEEIELIKEHLCKQRSIRRRILPYCVHAGQFYGSLFRRTAHLRCEQQQQGIYRGNGRLLHLRFLSGWIRPMCAAGGVYGR